MGAPWKKRDEPNHNDMNRRWFSSGEIYVSPEDVEVTSYCLLAYIAIGKGLDAKDLAMWLVKQQNTEGGFRSTQVTNFSTDNWN